MRKPAYILFTLLLVALNAPLAQSERTESQVRAELEEVRKQISELQKQRRRDGRKLSAAEAELKRAEQAEQQARSALTKVRNNLKATRSKYDKLVADQQQQQQVLTNLQADLALQMRMAYMQGQEQRIKLMLSEQDPGSMGRRLTWHEYLSNQRTELIDEVAGQLEELEKIAEELKAEAARLEALEADREEALAEVRSARAERESAVVNLRKDVSSSEARLAQLSAQAKALDKLVVELAAVLPEMPSLPSGPFSTQKGKLNWPVKGKLRRNYGERRGASQLRWNGVLIAAPAGNNVRAFSHGRVVYADWLQGMGLLMVIEHGDGYMSLYGHNQELLHGVGSWVQPGEVVARVGDSGGQSESGLYFELRKNGEPINPSSWVKK